MEEIKGFNTHRHERNPEEKEFHDTFLSHYGDNANIHYLIYGQRPGFDSFPKNYLEDNEKRIVASAMQWLGSPVGQGFLDRMGYEKKEK